MQYAVIYCRVSTDEQAEQGYSLDAQEKLCRDFAGRNGYQVRAVYRDEGRSGTTLERPALQDLLARCQQEHSIKAVIIQETDRLARNTHDHLAIKAVLRKADVKLISVAQPMLDDSPEGNMIDTIIASVNQFQSDINSRKTKKGLQEKFEEGWWPGWAPLGYLNVPLGGDDAGRSARKIIVKDPDRWQLLREGFALYLTGAYSGDALNDILFSRGLCGKGGKKIAHSLMDSILRNPFYAGQMRWHGQLRPGKHEPMITLAEHERILAIINEHNHNACRQRKHQFLLRGFLFCHQCGHRYTAEIHPKKGKAYYHCAVRRGHSNAGQNVNVDDLQRQVAEEFKTIQLDQDMIDRVLGHLQRIAGEQRDVAATERQVLFNRVQAIEARRDQAEEKLLRGVLDDQSFARIRDRLGQQLAQARLRLDELEHQQTLDLGTIQTVLRLLHNTYAAYQEAPDELKRRYLGLFWDKFLIRDRRIVRATPSRLVLAIREGTEGGESVIITPNWLPRQSVIITILNDWKYMQEVREKVAELSRGLVATGVTHLAA